MQFIDPRELNDLALKAAQGGLARGVALTDCVAEAPDQLMYIAGDVLILLRDLGDVLLASCEGVVGWVRKGDVRFDALDKTMRNASLELYTENRVPRTVLIAPSPPLHTHTLPDGLTTMSRTMNVKRVSEPFELESSKRSYTVETEGQQYFVRQEQHERAKRESIASIASSDALGGIGGFMIGDETSEEGRDSPDHSMRDDISPASASLETPLDYHSTPTSPNIASHLCFPGDKPNDVCSDVKEAWDPRRHYKHDTLNDGTNQMKMAQLWREDPKCESSSTNPISASPDGEGAVSSARGAIQDRGDTSGTQGRPNALDLQLGVAQRTPYVPRRRTESPITSVSGSSPSMAEVMTSRSVATELRLRIQRERRTANASQDMNMMATPLSASHIVLPEEAQITEAHVIATEFRKIPQNILKIVTKKSADDAGEGETSQISSEGSDHSNRSSSEGPQGSESSTIIETPHRPNEVIFTAPSPPTVHEALLGSPLTLNDASVPKPSLESMSSPNLAPPPPPSWSPNSWPHPPPVSWSPGSPASPHSIAATQQAVEAVRQESEGKRPRGMTLVGRMEADLSAAKGPVPITFLIGGPGAAIPSMGFGLPPAVGRATPEPRRTTSPTKVESPLPNHLANITDSQSRFPPIPVRSLTSPSVAPQVAGIATSPSTTAQVPATTSVGVKPVFFPARPRSRSFSQAVARSFSRGRKGSDTPPLAIVTTAVLPVPTVTTPDSAKRIIVGRASPSTPTIPAQLPLSRSPIATPTTETPPPPSTFKMQSSDSNPQPAFPSGRSSSFSFSSKSFKTPRKTSSRALPSPVSHKDFEDTVQADGMDFALVKPTLETPTDKCLTIVSGSSSRSLRVPLPETDEWGFLKERSPTPEIFQSRSAPEDHRAVEQKWLAIAASSMPSSGPAKRVRRLVVEAGIPSSLRGKVWAWFLASYIPARDPGKFDQLHGRDIGVPDARIDVDVASVLSDHSIFAEPSSPGRADLRKILRAYSNFATSGYTPPMAQVAGALLVHCVAEDAFWLLSGLVNAVLKDYWAKERTGMMVDAAIFEVLLSGSEKELSGVLKEVGLHPIEFLEGWFTQLFVLSLPWPTAMRVMDAVVSEGSRFLLVTSLTILTLSRDRILALPRSREPILKYLRELPQDSLLLPETFMRACERVKSRSGDWTKLRGRIQKEMGLV